MFISAWMSMWEKWFAAKTVLADARKELCKQIVLNMFQHFADTSISKSYSNKNGVRLKKTTCASEKTVCASKKTFVPQKKRFVPQKKRLCPRKNVCVPEKNGRYPSKKFQLADRQSESPLPWSSPEMISSPAKMSLPPHLLQPGCRHWGSDLPIISGQKEYHISSSRCPLDTLTSAMERPFQN